MEDRKIANFGMRLEGIFAIALVANINFMQVCIYKIYANVKFI